MKDASIHPHQHQILFEVLRQNERQGKCSTIELVENTFRVAGRSNLLKKLYFMSFGKHLSFSFSFSPFFYKTSSKLKSNITD